MVECTLEVHTQAKTATSWQRSVLPCMQHAYLKHILAIYKHIKAAILGVGEEQGARARGRERQNERERERKRRGERQGK